ncbi:archaetidylserine decarboxylase [Dasania sp. GY-MA-18]|uniref:Phosphatidylserine decarboxylase proenzyme n=1 Tax=Dasania phycosphaerae TaxID=2950436 RepID=A0A9J6RME2_9GAMM|nr:MULTISPECIES: archaetidylserine decarboxylase [Dasania]MCR8923106.1 archaetidylserine decarboxylase [Dasania sp. GY-MA-18]MCZ0865538.1 archaetidylserine decarboxylase [Dasania phycosphaerae]MCZ0869263.1 archaetidylserine decarboxylase [Dasania phycosphaerae]
MKILFIIAQYLTPQHLLSRLVGKVADCEWPWVKNTFITRFISHYGVNMSEAADPEPLNYKNFNAFFTRALAPDARPIVAGDNTIACPADGAISQLGDIENGRIFQAKGQSYSLLELLGGDVEAAQPFEGGKFATVYLSPKDYHRVHMPMAGTLKSMTYVPGDLFSVNGTTADNVPRLFARNERAVCIFDTDIGPMAVVLVGAMIVAGIETTWAGQVAPIKRQIQTHHYQQDGQAAPQNIRLEKGEEMGRFKLGSTAIVIFPKGVMEWDDKFSADYPTVMGELFGEITSA